MDRDRFDREFAEMDRQIDKGMKLAKGLFVFMLVVKLIVLSLLIWGGIVLVQWITSK